jgi:hypothetical protein
MYFAFFEYVKIVIKYFILSYQAVVNSTAYVV